MGETSRGESVFLDRTSMSSVSVPVGDYVWTAIGPIPAGSMVPSVEVAIVDQNGRVTTTVVETVTRLESRPVTHFLTSAGDLVLDNRSVVTTRDGKEFVGNLASRVTRGAELRLELARSSDLPPGKESDTPRDIHRSSLSLLDLPVVRVPRSLGTGRDIAHLLDVAEVEYVDVSDDRWTAYAFEPVAPAGQVGSLGQQAASSLATLTAWSSVSGALTTRTTLAQRSIRSRLAASYGAIGATASVSWIPGYRPVDARMTAGSPVSYATIVKATIEQEPTVEIRTSVVGSLVVDLAIVAAPLAKRG